MNASTIVTQFAAVSLSNVITTGSVVAAGGVERLVWHDDALGLCFVEANHEDSIGAWRDERRAVEQVTDPISVNRLRSADLKPIPLGAELRTHADAFAA